MCMTVAIRSGFEEGSVRYLLAVAQERVVLPNVANNRIAADREAGCCNSG